MGGAAALAACSDDTPEEHPRQPATTTPRQVRPALCAGRPRVRVAGRVSSPAAAEISGIVLSRSRPRVLWAHNDSGDAPRLLAFTTSGETVAEVALTGAEHFDWEDIAVGPAGALLVGDIGDNLAQRASGVVVYRVAEPRASGTVAVAARYELRYPDGARDAEALLFDRSTGSVVIVSKSYGGEAHVYSARRPSSRRPTTLRRGATIRLGAGGAVTAGDVSADGRTIVLRTYDQAYAWRRRAGEPVVAALRRRPCRVDADLLAEGQGEALAVTRDGRGFITVPEGTRPAVRRYEASAAVTSSGQ